MPPAGTVIPMITDACLRPAPGIIRNHEEFARQAGGGTDPAAHPEHLGDSTAHMDDCPASELRLGALHRVRSAATNGRQQNPLPARLPPQAEQTPRPNARHPPPP